MQNFPLVQLLFNSSLNRIAGLRKTDISRCTASQGGQHSSEKLRPLVICWWSSGKSSELHRKRKRKVGLAVRRPNYSLTTKIHILCLSLQVKQEGEASPWVKNSNDRSYFRIQLLQATEEKTKI